MRGILDRHMGIELLPLIPSFSSSSVEPQRPIESGQDPVSHMFANQAELCKTLRMRSKTKERVVLLKVGAFERSMVSHGIVLDHHIDDERDDFVIENSNVCSVLVHEVRIDASGSS